MDGSGHEFDLWTASSVGDLEYIRTVLATSTSIDRPNLGGWTCLMYASYYDHAQLVAFLIASGSNVQVGDRTALMLAASCGHVDVLNVLIRIGQAGLDRKQDHKGFTALCHAVVSGHLDACHVLLEAGSDVEIMEYSRGMTPLLLAAESGHERVVELLLRFGANAEFCVPSGENAAKMALKNGHHRLAKALHQLSLKCCPSIWTGPSQAAKLMMSSKGPGDVKSLLSELNLEKYQDAFENVSLDRFLEMNDADLRDLGISLLGPRRKITSAIERIRKSNG